MKQRILLAVTVTVLALGNLLGQAGQRGQAAPAGGAAEPAAQGARGGGRGGQAPQTPRAASPVDLTGYWVSVVTEDWRWRMVTPPKGDFASIPTNPAGVQVGQQWDPAKDEAAGEQCKSYGAPAVMRVPGRVHITWDNDTTLKVRPTPGSKLVCSISANFSRLPVRRRFRETLSQHGRPREAVEAGRGAGGSLKVVTTGMRAGYLRKNGYPYSDKTTVTEYYDRTNESNGDSWLIVMTIVNDPVYLAQEFVTSTHFKKQADNKSWSPQPCTSR